MTTNRPALTPLTFGELLRCWRRNRGLSQGDFGKLLEPKARHSAISFWERDLRLPSHRHLLQIGILTGIPTDALIGLEQPRLLAVGAAA